MTHEITSSQTIGPFPHEAWRWACELSERAATGFPTVTITGVLFDGQGMPVSDGWVEAWSPAAAGVERELPTPGFRRCATGEQGEFGFTLAVLPAGGPVEPAAWITVFGRGLLKHQFSAVFLADAAGLANSDLLEQVPSGRRDTLIARREPDGRYRWDIHLQGAHETVFLDIC